MKCMRRCSIDCAATGRTIARMGALNALSISDLSEFMNCSDQTVRRWMSGRSLPSFSNLAKLSEIFGVYPEDILVFVDGLENAKW